MKHLKTYNELNEIKLSKMGARSQRYGDLSPMNKKMYVSKADRKIDLDKVINIFKQALSEPDVLKGRQLIRELITKYPYVKTEEPYKSLYFKYGDEFKEKALKIVKEKEKEEGEKSKLFQ